ncbi:Kinetochore Sim4 complex subunit FTA2 domain containing protein [Rhypophila decipiens]
MATLAQKRYPEVVEYNGTCTNDGPSLLADVVHFPRGRNVGPPTCEGPKLRPFRPFGIVDKLEWLREVAVTDMSTVWKVEIDGKSYALKLFCFPLLDDYDRFERGREYLQDRFYYSDSFHCECRAYGRLKEANMDHIVVPCHGYVLLTPRQEEIFRNKSSTLPWGLTRRPEYTNTPVRGLVKDWVPEGTPNFDATMARRMKRDIAAMHSVGIINQDIKLDNYLGGKMLDFGIAWTVPHSKIDYCNRVIAHGEERSDACRQELQYLKDIDRDCFDTMVDQWNEKVGKPLIWERCFPNPEYSSLRYRHEVPFEAPTRATNPLLYDWKKAQKQRQQILRRSGKLDMNASIKARVENGRHKISKRRHRGQRLNALTK